MISIYTGYWYSGATNSANTSAPICWANLTPSQAVCFETAEPSAFLLFSTDRGDGWLYDVFTRQALCIVRRDRECPIAPVRYEEKRFIIGWDGEIDQTTPIPSLMPATEAAQAKLGSAYIFPEYVGFMLDDLGRQAERQARAFHEQAAAESSAVQAV